MAKLIQDFHAGLSVVLKYAPDAQIEGHDGFIYVTLLEHVRPHLTDREKNILRSAQWVEDEAANCWRIFTD